MKFFIETVYFLLEKQALMPLSICCHIEPSISCLMTFSDNNVSITYTYNDMHNTIVHVAFVSGFSYI